MKLKNGVYKFNQYHIAAEQPTETSTAQNTFSIICYLVVNLGNVDDLMLLYYALFETFGVIFSGILREQSIEFKH